MDRRFVLGVVLVSVVLLAFPFVPELIKRFGGVTASMVSESGAFSPITPRGVFYANGRFWVFYSDGGNIVYSTSTDGATWTDPTVVTGGNQGCVISVYFDGRYLHYGGYLYYGEGGIFYRKGIPNSDGTITWVADEQRIPSPMGHPVYPSITVDSNGYAWIGFLDGPGYGTDSWFYITRSGNNDGTWGETPEGFPYLLEQASDVIPLSLSSGKVLVVYRGRDDGTLRMQLWNGSSWTETDVMDFVASTIYAVARGDTAYILAQNEHDYWIYLFKYVSGTVTSERIYRPTGLYPSFQLNIEPDTGILHIFWQYPHGVFRHIWGREGSWCGPEVWFDARTSVDGWTVSYSSPLCLVYSVREFDIGHPGPPYPHKIMFAYSPPAPPSPPPPPPENRENIHWENMYLGGGSMTVSAFAYYFTSDRGCVLLVRAVCENGDPLPAGTKVRIGSEYLPQVEYDVWYRVYPAGTPPPSTVFVTFEVPGYINISQAVPVSERGLLGDLQVFTVDEKGNPIPALVEVRMNGVLVGSQQSTGVASFRGLSAGKATVSAVVSPSGKEGFSCLLSPPPAEVDVAPNKMSTATLVFKRVYDTSVTGRVSVTNTGSYPLVITIDGAVTCTVFPGETAYLELPAGDHYAMYTGTEPLLYDPQVMSFTLGKDEEEHLRLRVSPARDENWVSEWMENARKGVGVGDLAVIVCDMVSGTPIPGASVYLDVGLQQTTNSSGLCYFRGVPTGDRKVKACTQGYFPATATARVEEGAVASVRVCLRGFLYEAKPAPPTGRYLILGFLAILLPGVVMIWQYRRR